MKYSSSSMSWGSIPESQTRNTSIIDSRLSAALSHPDFSTIGWELFYCPVIEPKMHPTLTSLLGLFGYRDKPFGSARSYLRRKKNVIVCKPWLDTKVFSKGSDLEQKLELIQGLREVPPLLKRAKIKTQTIRLFDALLDTLELEAKDGIL